VSKVCPGVCRHCGCHDGDPCWHCRAFGDCCWLTRERLVCMQPACVIAEQARAARAQAEAKAAKPRKPYARWGYGAIAIDKRNRERREKRRGKGRAA
jgi:hypothetical protein